MSFDFKAILKGIPNYDSVLVKAKDFSLHARLMNIFKEVERVEKVAALCKLFPISSDVEERSIMEKLMYMLKDSNRSLKQEYECFTDEIELIEAIKEIDRPIVEIQGVGNKLISSGWKGTIAFLGEKSKISMINSIVDNYFQRMDDKEDISLWISDETKNLFFQSKFGGSACLLNPVYDDFYLTEIYDEKEIFRKFIEDQEKMNARKEQEDDKEGRKKDVNDGTQDSKVEGNSFDIRF